MRLLRFHWSRRAGRIFQEHQIAQPRACRGFESAFPVRSPQIHRASERLLSSVVEVVSKRTDLRLKFNGRNQASLDHHKQIPFFLRSKPSWKIDMPFAIDYWPIDARLFQEISDQSHKTVHLAPASNRGSSASIANTCLLPLLL